MWFLKGSPSSIKVKAVISSINNGYQQTNYRFTVDSLNQEEKIFIGIAVPWSPHKENGSIKFNNIDHLSEFEEKEEFENVNTNDIVIYNRLRTLKTLETIDMVHVQDLINWYLDDIAVMTFWVECGKTYQLNYSHKIAPDSCLFLPSRLPTIIANRNPEINYKIWVINGMCYDLPKFLVKNVVSENQKNVVSPKSLNLLTFNNWDWDSDTRISTNNWDSSDDGEPDDGETECLLAE